MIYPWEVDWQWLLSEVVAPFFAWALLAVAVFGLLDMLRNFYQVWAYRRLDRQYAKSKETGGS